VACPNLIIHLDEIVVHSATPREHLEHLPLLLQWLWHHSIKINLTKSEIGSTELSFLGFRLTPESIVPREDHLKALQQSLSPSSVQEIRQFLGMSEYYLI
jgi:hypothetical protein